MIGDVDDFDFYLSFSKPLVLNLPDAKDRTIAALWVKKLRDMQSDGPEANMRIEYLKLLLFVMQRNKLTGIFEKAPPDGPLQGFPPNYKATEMLSLVKPGKSLPPVYPPVYTSVGGDLCQFVAVQEIPNFGLHGYYAVSTEPLSKWSHASTNAARRTAMKPKHFADCFKNTCELVETTHSHKNSEKSDPPASPPPPQSSDTEEQQPGPSGENSEKLADSKGDGQTSGKTRQQNECEKIPGTTTTQFLPLPTIPFQTFRKEIAGFESRPTWGRSRYIERLIDESPHLAADLDVSQADALLRAMNDKIFKKADNYGPCAISESRRRVERMLDLPPCAVDPGEQRLLPAPKYTCCPKREKVIDTSCVDVCQSELDFYPCGRRSYESLRGGSDSGSCCASRKQKLRPRTFMDSRNDDTNFSRPYYAPKFSSTRIDFPRRGGLIFDDTDEPSDIDTSIHDATTRTKYIDPDKAGNFKWLEEVEHITLSDPIETSFTESDSRSRMWSRPFSSDTMTNDFYQPETEGCSEFDEAPPINEQLEPEELMPQVAQRMQSSRLSHSQRSRFQREQRSPRSCNNRSSCEDSWEQQAGRTECSNEDSEPSIAVVRRRFAKSREARNRKPEIHEKTYRWKEIIDQTEPSRDQSSYSRGAHRIQSLDPEYLDYIEAVKTDRGYCCEEEDEEMEEPRYSGRAVGHALDEEMARYTKRLLRPQKPPPSPGRVTMPLSKQNRRPKTQRPKTEEMEYRQPSDTNIDEEKSD